MRISKYLSASILAFLCLIGFYSKLRAQDDKSLGNWNSLMVKGRIDPKWGLMGEAHLRSQGMNFKYNYFEVKTGVSYNFNKSFASLIGMGIYQLYKPDEFFDTPALTKEFRTWLELSYKHALNRLNIDHRIREEQRFLPNAYQNRFRYRLAFTYPLNKPTIVKGTFSLLINDEIWLPLDGGITLGKNRLYGGLGYKVSNTSAFQVGLINDNDYKNDYHIVSNYLQIMFLYDFSKFFEKKHS